MYRRPYIVSASLAAKLINAVRGDSRMKMLFVFALVVSGHSLNAQSQLGTGAVQPGVAPLGDSLMKEPKPAVFWLVRMVGAPLVV